MCASGSFRGVKKSTSFGVLTWYVPKTKMRCPLDLLYVCKGEWERDDDSHDSLRHRQKTRLGGARDRF
jgi:hypothetical protein